MEPITNSEGRLYQDWANLFEEMSGRFMVGTDEKFGRPSKDIRTHKGKTVTSRKKKSNKYRRTIRLMRKILGSLSPKAAELIAYKNAENIFK